MMSNDAKHLELENLQYGRNWIQRS
jgi:hypothetical protein